ncbi:MAG: phage tail sheath C-terminal domain-containing protein, partial [bacterium]
QKVNWEDPADPNFFVTRMAADPFIVIEAEDEDENATCAKLPDGDWKLGQAELPEGVDINDVEIIEHNVGTNGWTEVDGIITSMSNDFKKALTKIYNPEVYEFNLVAVPGTADPIVQNAIQDICESRKDCFGVIDAAPFGIGLGIKDGINDVTEVTSAVGTINSSYVGAFWPWLQDYDADNEQYIWLPPSIYALKSMIYTDNIADPWFAPAGTTRGKVSALDVEYSPSRPDRDLLYGDTNIVNPIVYFVGEGITIWGQKTGQRTKSATDRINVRRLLIYAEKLIAKMARGFLFEPNDSANWAAFTRQANAILEPIRQRRGLYQYTVICDESTNTADLINQNIMAGKIFVQPTKTTEFIEVEFTINAAGEVEVTE